MTTAYALVAPLRLAEDARRVVRTLGIGRTDLKVGRRENHILIPLERPIDPPFAGTSVEVAEFNSTRPPKSYKDAVQIPDKYRPLLPTGFDMIGDLVLIKIPPEIRPFGPAIGEAILKVHKHIQGVFHDDGVQGPFRVRQLAPLAGVTRTRTTHTEYATPIVVDVAKAYFSPRLANEHERVARAVQPGEIVVDATAGVGPFTLLIARQRRAATVFAVDLNPEAVALLRENVKTNRLEDRVDVMEGDAAKVLESVPPFDRAIVNLPQGGEEILGAALRRAKAGAILHYYRVWPHERKDAAIEVLLSDLRQGTGRGVDVTQTAVVHAYSPTDRLYSVDLHVGAASSRGT